GPDRYVGIAGGVDVHPAPHAKQTGLRRYDHAADFAAFGQHVDAKGMEQKVDACPRYKLVPHPLQHRRVVGDPGPGPIRVWTVHRGPVVEECVHDFHWNAAHNAPRLGPGGEKTVERIEHRGTRAAQEAVTLDQGHTTACPCRGDRRVEARGPASDHYDIGLSLHGHLAHVRSQGCVVSH